MKVSVNCKLDTNSAYGFIKPLADIRYISKVDVFRDYESLPHEKIEYHKPLFGRIGLLGQLLKLFAMLKIIKNDNKLVIGIYEIPHGLLAFLIGKLRRIPIVISIVGNPGYKVIRKGIRKKITYFMYNRISAITVMGTHSRNYLIKDGIISKNIFILTGPIDIGYFREIPSIDKKYDIISIGRLSPEKELLNLIEIASLIKKTHPKIKIGIAGDGPEKIRLEEEICRLKLNNNIDMVGYLNGPLEFYNSGKVFDSYGLKDGGVSAFECSTHECYHIDTERSIVECVDNGSNQIINGKGKVLATSLYNYSMPFIRYDTGDLAKVINKKCSCGRDSKLFDEITGRSVDIFITPEGKYVHGWFFLYLFWEYEKGINAYQVIQKSESLIQIKIVPERNFDYSIIAKIEKMIKTKSLNWNVEFEYVEKIISTESGKYKFIISHIDFN